MEPDSLAMTVDQYWNIRRELYKKVTGEKPIELRNPFTGEIFWMQQAPKK